MTLDPNLPVSLRPMVDGDLNFIRSSWLKSNARTVPERVASRDAYFALHWEVAMALLDRPRAVTLVAANSSPVHRDQIAGWVCGEPGTEEAPAGLVHFVYVKKAFRKCGLGRHLIESVLEGGSRTDVTATHLPTESLRQRLTERGWHFRPQFAFYLAAETAA